MRHLERLFPSVFVIVLLVGAQVSFAQKGALQIDYTVTLNDPATQQFHIKTDIKNINQPQLTLSLPTWTPGWYVVENYYKNVLRFKITDTNGKRLPNTMSKKQTWNVDTRNVKSLRVEYDYRATVLALNQAKIDTDYAFFTGIELFLQAEGHRNEPSTLHLEIPSGWKIVTPLKSTNDPNTFIAANYDTLVDAPVQIGNFDVTKFEVEGKPHTLVTNPAGAFSPEKAQKFTEMLAKVAQADSKMFGGLPYDNYVYYYFFRPAESNASGALEHLNSFVAFAPPGNIATPEMIIGTAAHEFFHLWNVKRFRPAEMWPYDYSRENETPLLWVSEGFTNYYGIVSRYRAGLLTPENFVQAAADAAGGVENNDARNYISPAQASVSTWVGYDSPTAFSISYYTQGQNLGALLDLSIRHDTNGESSLDDVMRAFYSENYKRGKGFTTEDMLAVIRRITKKDYHDFYRKYVFGVEVPDYDKIFGYAGYDLVKRTAQAPDFGFSIRGRNGGLMVNAVDPNGSAAAAGLKKGDIIKKINGEEPQRAGLGGLAGKTITLTVERGGAETDVSMKVGSRDVIDYSMAEVANPTAKQLKIRAGWLKR